MFDKILVANRGEIACRIIATCRRLGIDAVAVFSEADRGALHVGLADDAYCIGPAPARDSYLNVDGLLEAARRSGAQAVHPGYGFLSESPVLAEACAAHDLTFIGPGPETLRLVGDKSAAKRLMVERGIPVVSGYQGNDQDLETLARQAEAVGFPLLVKAAAGGGGKGMRLVEHKTDLMSALSSARREAETGFGDGRLLLERYLAQPRHIEVQIFGDRHGNYIHLHERDCSIQRRYQKVVEEAPAPGLAQPLREGLAQTAVAAAEAAGYVGAGTVEFLVDGDGHFYFMEINARLQVEHPVTEAITGLDLVEWQLLTAAGEPLPMTQKEIGCHGHAIEARLYGEKPAQAFLPASGALSCLRLPDRSAFLRIECGVREGDVVGAFYDPLIAKIIAFGDSREQAIHRLHGALCRTRLVGLETNREFLVRLLGRPEYRRGVFDTGFIAREAASLCPAEEPADSEVHALAAVYLSLVHQRQVKAEAEQSDDPFSPWNDTFGWWLNLDSRVEFDFSHNGERMKVAVEHKGGSMVVKSGGCSFDVNAWLDERGDLVAELNGVRHTVTAACDGGRVTLATAGGTWRLDRFEAVGDSVREGADEGQVVAPIPGRITELKVNRGVEVRKGDPLLVLEAMKLEYDLAAPRDGIVVDLHIAVGDQVTEGDTLLVIADASAA